MIPVHIPPKIEKTGNIEERDNQRASGLRNTRLGTTNLVKPGRVQGKLTSTRTRTDHHSFIHYMLLPKQGEWRN
jgi:hypothetical protein